MSVAPSRPVFIETTLYNYPDAFTIAGNFTPQINLIWRFTNNGKSYSGIGTTDNAGTLTIPVNGSNELNQNDLVSINGQWRLRLSTIDNSGNEVPVKYQSSVDFIVFTFQPNVT